MPSSPLPPKVRPAMASTFADARLKRPCGFCIAAWGIETARDTCDGHTDAAFAIARGLARAIHGRATLARVGWFMEDGNAIAEELGQPRAVAVSHAPETPGGWPVFEVNGRQFTYDVNAEGFNTLEPIER